ncbi:ParB family chromosome partitioning protein [Halopolyspora algeriensis]|uniref:ParB family chromosome partitioning protein n=1 Tax=Halopolyspora algeriensis TaxID=1500506 RepID=A0A368VYE5_9ACTN|nr:ParB/RepB/Spo0J family partition protein [Halopolyspora algeriensis]RCW47226.1 ParB family chromosome partitioning protein [Halopolyspora algeriensis]TQM48311.1 ParB family chromosome partitioning protein [Halopolyspora algeriensis]
MTERRGGLGRGLAALIPSAPPEENAEAVSGGARSPESPNGGHQEHRTYPEQETSVSRETGGTVAGAVYREVDIAAITPNPRQPRQVFDEEALAELEHSISEFGLMQPIVVRDTGDGHYELIMGERRWRAAQRAGLEVLPAIVRQIQDDALLRDALLENIHRVQLNPLEEASAYQQLLDEFGVTHDELADRIGRSRPVITNTIRLLRLPLPVQRRVAAGVLSAGHARALLSMEDPNGQEELASRVIAEGLSVRATEEAVTLWKGTEAAKPKPAPRKRMEVPGSERLAEKLSDQWDTTVKVESGQRKGRIVIEFGSAEDLERLAELMLPNSAENPVKIDDR